jgi:hypothetical protein
MTAVCGVNWSKKLPRTTDLAIYWLVSARFQAHSPGSFVAFHLPYTSKNAIFAMNMLKSIPFKKLILALVPVAFLAVSCQPDEAEPTDDRDKFVDVWHCVEQSSQIIERNPGM